MIAVSGTPLLLFVLLALACAAWAFLAAVPNASPPYRTRYLVLGFLSALAFMAIFATALFSIL